MVSTRGARLFRESADIEGRILAIKLNAAGQPGTIGLVTIEEVDAATRFRAIPTISRTFSVRRLM